MADEKLQDESGARRQFLKMAAVGAAALTGGVTATEGLLAASPKQGFRKIALEEHFLTPDAMPYIVAAKARRGYAAPSVDELPSRMIQQMLDVGEGRIAAMDASGIDVMILSQATGDGFNNPDFAAEIDFAKRTNDYLAERVAAHPSRFAGFASLPLPDPKAAVAELERAVTKLGFKGVMQSGHIMGEYLDSPKFAPFWETLQALDVPLYLHPANAHIDNVKMYQGQPSLLGPTWAYTFDTATHALRIINGGVFDRFPKVQMILGHMGEALPHQLARLDQGWHIYSRSPGAAKLQRKPSDYFRTNIQVTTSGNHSAESLICTMSAIGADRIMFATDYPFISLQEMADFVNNAPISATDKEKICRLNAQRLFRL